MQVFLEHRQMFVRRKADRQYKSDDMYCRLRRAVKDYNDSL